MQDIFLKSTEKRWILTKYYYIIGRVDYNLGRNRNYLCPVKILISHKGACLNNYLIGLESKSFEG